MALSLSIHPMNRIRFFSAVWPNLFLKHTLCTEKEKQREREREREEVNSSPIDDDGGGDDDNNDDNADDGIGNNMETLKLSLSLSLSLDSF
mgnify:CR=1 FL=1